MNYYEIENKLRDCTVNLMLIYSHALHFSLQKGVQSECCFTFLETSAPSKSRTIPNFSTQLVTPRFLSHCQPPKGHSSISTIRLTLQPTFTLSQLVRVMVTSTTCFESRPEAFSAILTSPAVLFPNQSKRGFLI